MKRQKPLWFSLIVLLLVPGLLSACGANTPSEEQTFQLEVLPTPNLSEADGVAQTFLAAWEQGDFQGMYSHLSSTSQASYSLPEFTTWYTTTADVMSLEGLTTQLNAELTQGDSAQVTFRVTYDTRMLGAIDHDLTMNLVFDGQRWGVVWSPTLIFEGLCNTCVLTLDAQTPARANIYDREGQWLAQEDAAAVTVAVVPELIGPDHESLMLEQLSVILRQSVTELFEKYDGRPSDWEIALGDTDFESYNANLGVFNSYPALRVYEKTGRRYHNALAPHVLGYTGFIPEGQCPEWQLLGYTCDEIVGIDGLESWGEEFLAGQPSGRLSIFTTGGEFITDVTTVAPVPSQSLYTTIDRRLQTIVQNALQDAYYASRETWGAPRSSPGAAVVVIDVDNGDILAMASYPEFDPNVFNPVNLVPDSQTRIQGYLDDYRKPLLNRAAQGEYPPGSVFKVISMAAALGDGGYVPGTPYTCLGFWDGLGAANRKPDWLPRGHGTIPLSAALTYSCDPYFYQVGLNTGNLDYGMLPEYARGFGLGAPTGLEQLGESPGLIPDEEWMVQARGREWTISDSVNVAIGQGDILVTPLQAATMMAAVANGGTLYKPQLVREIALIGEEPTWVAEPEAMGSLPVTADNLAVIQDSLWNVQRDTFGTAAHILGRSDLPMAGKTGTAQAPGETALPHAWFVGYAPADAPQISIAVMVENGGQGSDIAAPIFRRIAEEYLLGEAEGGYRFPDFWYNPEEYEQAIATPTGD
jgi:penicillin-binding protein 2